MNQKIDKRKRFKFTPLDKAASIQLIMITIVIIAYVMFLIFQRYLFSFESLQSKLLIVNILLAAGIVMEISYFIWTMHKKRKKAELKAKKKTATVDEEKEDKEQEQKPNN